VLNYHCHPSKIQDHSTLLIALVCQETEINEHFEVKTRAV